MPEISRDDIPDDALTASQAAQHHMGRAMNSLRVALEAEGFTATGGIMAVQIDVEGVGGVVTTLSFPVGEWEACAEIADETARVFRQQAH